MEIDMSLPPFTLWKFIFTPALTDVKAFGGRQRRLCNWWSLCLHQAGPVFQWAPLTTSFLPERKLRLEGQPKDTDSVRLC